MNRLLTPLFLCASLLLSPCLAARPDAQDPSVTITPLKGGLQLLRGRGGNVLLSLGEDGILQVDTDYPEYAAAYEQAIKSLGGERPRFIINTHWHGDHVGGNAFWGERDAVIVAHQAVRERMSTRQEMKRFQRIVEPSPAPALPLVTYADALVLHVNGDTVEVQHYPRGHTDGDSVVFFVEQNVVHMGDHMFNGAFPFVDLGSGGNVLAFTRNVAAILQRVDDQTIVVPGHGALASSADLQQYHQMLVETTAEVRAMASRSESREAILEQGLDDKWQSWGRGFIDEPSWIGFILDSL
jgi:glyoxylase-like metal-dependent hydrolase (beta-lactamase superfamily II)